MSTCNSSRGITIVVEHRTTHPEIEGSSPVPPDCKKKENVLNRLNFCSGVTIAFKARGKC
jgi:hypothetical protein